MSCEDDTEDMSEDTEEGEREEVEDRGVMDAHMAAMVLTTLSCSPVSPAPFNFCPPDKGERGSLKFSELCGDFFLWTLFFAKA